MNKIANEEDKMNAAFKHNQSERVLCRQCALKAFTTALYEYRLELSENQYFKGKSKGGKWKAYSELFLSKSEDQLKSRVDCTWGKDCRTQKHNYEHAK